jgi:hypothetical protein
VALIVAAIAPSISNSVMILLPLFVWLLMRRPVSAEDVARLA